MNKDTIKMIEDNTRDEEGIFDENQKIYTNMIIYLRGSDLTDYDQELVRRDLIELIFDGQERGDNIETVMGGNYKEVCDEIIDALPKKTKRQKNKEVFDISLNLLWILTSVKFLENLIDELGTGKPKLTFTLTIGDLTSWGLIIVLAIKGSQMIFRGALKENKGKKRFVFWKEWLMAGMIFAAIVGVRFLFRSVILDIPIIFGLIISILVFLASRLSSNKMVYTDKTKKDLIKIGLITILGMALILLIPHLIMAIEL